MGQHSGGSIVGIHPGGSIVGIHSGAGIGGGGSIVGITPGEFFFIFLFYFYFCVSRLLGIKLESSRGLTDALKFCNGS